MAERRPIPVCPGAHVLPLPTPFHVGDVNAVLLQGAQTVLVDCGPDTTDALRALEEQLAQLGTGLDRLDLLVLTHPHPDHFGLAAAIVRRTGVEVAALQAGVAVFEDWEGWSSAADHGICADLVRHGLPSAIAHAVLHAGFVHPGFAHSVRIDRHLHDGDRLDLGDRALEVLHVPGHSPADTAFHDRAARLLIGGDHVLASMPSVALAQRLDQDWDGDRPRALMNQRASLRRTAMLDVDVVVGGHGSPFGDLETVIAQRLAEHDQRATQLLGLLDDEPRTAYELATDLWGGKVLELPYATLSMVLGHLDLLVARDLARELQGAQVSCFVQADGEGVTAPAADPVTEVVS